MNKDYIEIVSALESLQQIKKEVGIKISIARIATICIEMQMANRDALFVRSIFGYTTALKSYQVNNAEKILSNLAQNQSFYVPKVYWQRVWFKEKIIEMEKNYPELNPVDTKPIFQAVHDTPALEVAIEIAQEVWNPLQKSEKPPKQEVIREMIREKLESRGAKFSDNTVNQIDCIARPIDFKK